MGPERREQTWEHVTRADRLQWLMSHTRDWRGKIEDSSALKTFLEHLVGGAVRRGRAPGGWQPVIGDLTSQVPSTCAVLAAEG